MDGQGIVYLNGGSQFLPAAAAAEGRIVLITPGGAVGQAADEIALRNGMAATPDNSTLITAESFGGRLTTYDIVTDGSLSNQRVGRGVQRRDLARGTVDMGGSSDVASRRCGKRSTRYVLSKDPCV